MSMTNEELAKAIEASATVRPAIYSEYESGYGDGHRDAREAAAALVRANAPALRPASEATVGEDTWRELPYTVVRQGSPRTGGRPAVVIAEGKEVIVAIIDLASKRCDVDDFGDDRFGPELRIRETPDSLYLDESKAGVETLIRFDGLVGWRVYFAECSKYTIRVVFLHRDV